MANSFVDYTGDGSTTLFSVTFGFIQRADVSVDEIISGSPISFTWISDTQIQISPAPTSGLAFRISRSTNVATRVVDFQDGTNLSEIELDLSALQLFYLVQETLDTQTLNIKLNNADAALAPKTLPVFISDGVIKMNAAGTDLEAVAITDIAAGEIGVDVQAYDADLAAIAAAAHIDGDAVIDVAGTWTAVNLLDEIETQLGALSEGDVVYITGGALAVTNLKGLVESQIGSLAQGDIIYVDAAGELVRLPAGTSGQLLKTNGAGANPQWVDEPSAVGLILALTG